MEAAERKAEEKLKEEAKGKAEDERNAEAEPKVDAVRLTSGRGGLGWHLRCFPLPRIFTV